MVTAKDLESSLCINKKADNCLMLPRQLYFYQFVYTNTSILLPFVLKKSGELSPLFTITLFETDALHYESMSMLNRIYHKQR